jgi:hypothetical protein
MRRLILVSAYNTFNVPLTEDDMCIIETRAGRGEITINEAVERFSLSQSILSSYIFDMETRQITNLPTQWDSIRLAQVEARRQNIISQIERLQAELEKLN